MTQVYQVNMPTVSSNTYAFSFTTTINGSGWGFVFLFINGHWSCLATPPANSNPDLALLREAAVFDQTLSWSGYPDYGCYFICAVPEPGLNDIGNVQMYIVDWRF